MEIQNKGFNDYFLGQFGRTISKEELEVILNLIIQDINKLHVINPKIRKVAIEAIKKIFEAILKNEEIDIEKEAKKATIDVMEEIGLVKVKRLEEKRLLITICEYIKMKIEWTLKPSMVKMIVIGSIFRDVKTNVISATSGKYYRYNYLWLFNKSFREYN